MTALTLALESAGQRTMSYGPWSRHTDPSLSPEVRRSTPATDWFVMNELVEIKL